MQKRDFLAVNDFTRDDIARLFELAERMKRRTYRETPLAGKTLAMIFAKSSTRTRVAFETGPLQLGGGYGNYIANTVLVFAIGTVAIGMLVGLLGELMLDNRRLILAGANSRLQRVLSITRVSSLMEISPTLEQALNLLEPATAN